MAGVNADINVGINVSQTGTRNRGSQSFTDTATFALKFKAGNATTSQTDVLFSDTRTLTASSSENLDLRGSLVDALGATINAAEITAIYVQAVAGNTNDVVVGGATSNAFVGPFGASAHTIAVQPGDCFLATSKKGWTVTAGTGDLLKIANSGAGTSVTYNIIILGRTIAA